MLNNPPAPEPDDGPGNDRDHDPDHELAALIDAGGFWRLAPEWVPRTGYAEPTPALLRDVEAGLRRRLAGE
ncbi:hypothetical protein [Streptomyces sp. NPDC088261]|uniref:hypothetical protein n=1 Tax=Streptomyces sp. NPDC088261 TaxID=3365851 RepID=UPI003813F8A0